MIFDVNAWIGHWPFRQLRDNTAQGLLGRLDRLGITWAAVSSIDAVLYRNVHPANERLVEEVAPFGERLFPIGTVNPTYARWEDDLTTCHELLGVVGIRLIPTYHGYDVDGPECIRAVEACKERGLPVLIPQRLEDARQRHHLDPGHVVDLNRVARLVTAVPDAVILVTNARGAQSSALVRDPALRGKPWYIDLSLAEAHYMLHRDTQHMHDLVRVIETVGPHHLLFGTHLPFSYGGAALVKRATLPVHASALDAISYVKACEIFGLGHLVSSIG